MRVQLAQQVQELVGTSELVIITERVDDVALLIGHMVKMGFVEVLDRHIPRHWQQRELSWGWTAVIWLAYILTEGDHRKVSVEAYIQGMHHTLSHLSGQVITPLDFSDDRLGHLLKHLSKPTYWHEIERELNARSLEVYALSQDVIRCDATTVSGTHEVSEGGLLQFGHSKDDPSRPQIKVMMGSLDPLGMPLATDVLSGERADDGLYIPLIKRLEAGMSQTGLLFVGDCKMSALGTRAYVVGRQHMYLSPLPLTGATAEAMAAWISEGIAQGRDGALERLFRRNHRDEEALVAEGYEFERSCGLEEGEAEWTERVLVVRSPAHAERQAAGLEKRLATAEQKLAALTPARGRGKRQITEEATARGGDCQGAQGTAGRGIASGRMATADRAAHPLRRAGTRLGNASTAGNGEHPLSPHPHHPPGRPHQSPHATLWLESLRHECASRAAFVERCHLVLSQRIPYRTHLQPPQEPRAYCAAVCQAQRPNRGPHVPADARRPSIDGHGVCSSAVSAERSRQTPRLAPGKQDKDDRHANGGADPESVCGRFADHHKAGRRRGHPASVDTLVRGAEDHPAMSGVGYFSLSSSLKFRVLEIDWANGE